MRQHIDTAPIWAAYEADGECALCALARETERGYIEAFLGGSVMEPAVRVEVNEKGFCADHFRQLYGAGNRLGLALMAHTHLKEQIRQLRASAPPKPSIFGKRVADAPHTPSCIVCDRLSDTMARYAETLVYLWRHEPTFRTIFERSKGPCLPHYAALAASGAAEPGFVDALTTLTKANLERVEKDLEWFTLKFDYRNQDKPWGDSRDAVERALNKLRGRVIER